MFLPVDYGKILCSSANELHQNSNASAKEEFDIFHEHWLLCSRFIAFTFELCDRLSFACLYWKKLKPYNYEVDQSEFLTRFRTDCTS